MSVTTRRVGKQPRCDQMSNGLLIAPHCVCLHTNNNKLLIPPDNTHEHPPAHAHTNTVLQ